MQCRDADFLPQSHIEQYGVLLGIPEELRKGLFLKTLLFDEISSIKDLPPTHIMVCGDDPLRDHGMIFKQKLDRMGLDIMNP